jgi:hypothetical protein
MGSRETRQRGELRRRLVAFVAGEQHRRHDRAGRDGDDRGADADPHPRARARLVLLDGRPAQRGFLAARLREHRVARTDDEGRPRERPVGGHGQGDGGVGRDGPRARVRRVSDPDRAHETGRGVHRVGAEFEPAVAGLRARVDAHARHARAPGRLGGFDHFRRTRRAERVRRRDGEDRPHVGLHRVAVARREVQQRLQLEERDQIGLREVVGLLGLPREAQRLVERRGVVLRLHALDTRMRVRARRIEHQRDRDEERRGKDAEAAPMRVRLSRHRSLRRSARPFGSCCRIDRNRCGSS